MFIVVHPYCTAAECLKRAVGADKECKCDRTEVGFCIHIECRLSFDIFLDFASFVEFIKTVE